MIPVHRFPAFVLACFLLAACFGGGPGGDGQIGSTPTSEPSPTFSTDGGSPIPSATATPGAKATPSPLPGGTGITGIASIGPTCPVERLDSPCPDRPFQGVVVAKAPGGAEVARTTTDPQGAFSISLPPGQYQLTAVVAGSFPRAIPTDVNVVPGQFTTVHLRLDSGIR